MVRTMWVMGPGKTFRVGGSWDRLWWMESFHRLKIWDGLSRVDGMSILIIVYLLVSGPHWLVMEAIPFTKRRHNSMIFNGPSFFRMCLECPVLHFVFCRLEQCYLALKSAPMFQGNVIYLIFETLFLIFSVFSLNHFHGCFPPYLHNFPLFCLDPRYSVSITFFQIFPTSGLTLNLTL